MALFRYKALSSAGEVLEGQMEAASAEDVAARLQDQGHLPMETQLADGGAIGGSSWRNLLLPTAQTAPGQGGTGACLAAGCAAAQATAQMSLGNSSSRFTRCSTMRNLQGI